MRTSDIDNCRNALANRQMEKTHQTSDGTPEGVRPGSSPVTPEGFREKETAPSAKSRRKAPGQLTLNHRMAPPPHLQGNYAAAKRLLFRTLNLAASAPFWRFIKLPLLACYRHSFRPAFQPFELCNNNQKLCLFPEGVSEKRKWKSLSRVRLFATAWATEPMELSRPEVWRGQPLPSPGIFPTQGSNPGLLHCRRILYQLSHKEDLLLKRKPASDPQHFRVSAVHVGDDCHLAVLVNELPPHPHPYSWRNTPRLTFEVSPFLGFLKCTIKKHLKHKTSCLKAA